MVMDPAKKRNWGDEGSAKLKTQSKTNRTQITENHSTSQAEDADKAIRENPRNPC